LTDNEEEFKRHEENIKLDYRMHVVLPRILFGISVAFLVGMIISGLLNESFWFIGTMFGNALFFYEGVILLDSKRASQIGACIFAVPVFIAVIILVLAFQYLPEYGEWISWFVVALIFLMTYLAGFIFMFWRALKRW